jgi:hypothetical protein
VISSARWPDHIRENEGSIGLLLIEANVRGKSEHGPNTSGGKWVAGRSGNPSGRPLGSRQKISEKLLTDLAEVWEDQGKTVLARLAVDDPGKLAQIAYGLLPRDVFISVEQRTPGNLDPDEWAILRRVIDLIQTNAKGAELGPVLETIENALRADQAKMIEAERVGPPGGAQSAGRPLPAVAIRRFAADLIQREED